MTAVPRTAAARASTRRYTEQPLCGNQHEPTRRRPQAAVAAEQTSSDFCLSSPQHEWLLFAEQQSFTKRRKQLLEV